MMPFEGDMIAAEDIIAAEGGMIAAEGGITGSEGGMSFTLRLMDAQCSQKNSMVPTLRRVASSFQVCVVENKKM